MKKYVRCLTIAGSDSGGGAGIQADLKTFAALGAYGMSVITALTAQNTVAVTAVHAAPPEFVAAQLDAVLSDMGCDVVKLGMLYNAEIISAIAEKLREYKIDRIVLDPVMVSKSGAPLLQPDAIAALKRELLPIAALITPNLPEASVLLGREVTRSDQMEKAAADLIAFGCHAVLIKGGHAGGDSADDYFRAANGQSKWLRAARIDTQNTHGTGCTYSAAIAAFLAKGAAMPDAIRAAKEYLTAAIRAGAEYKLGTGHGPLQHLYKYT